jgi:hypothetical protein
MVVNGGQWWTETVIPTVLIIFKWWTMVDIIKKKS